MADDKVKTTPQARRAFFEAKRTTDIFFPLMKPTAALRLANIGLLKIGDIKT
jgi:hypothetical protein